MAHSEEVILRRSERTERRRTQILEAASKCFREEGFHSASINKIARTAGISVGHMYTLFESKESIIAALCSRDFEAIMTRGLMVGSDSDVEIQDIYRGSVESFDLLCEPGSAATLLEVMAEAGRNLKVAAILGELDIQIRARTQDLLSMVMPSLTAVEVEARAEMWVLLIQGVAMRVTANRTEDRTALRNGFAGMMRGIFAPT